MRHRNVHYYYYLLLLSTLPNNCSRSAVPWVHCCFLSFQKEERRGGWGRVRRCLGTVVFTARHGQSSVLEPALVATRGGAGGSLQSPPPPKKKKNWSKSLIYSSSVHRTCFLSWKGCRTNTAVFLTVCAHASGCLLRIIIFQGRVGDVCT